MYWAEALVNQTKDTELQQIFKPIAKSLKENETAIISELNSIQGKAMDIGGYYYPNDEQVFAAMRPNSLFNKVLEGIK